MDISRDTSVVLSATYTISVVNTNSFYTNFPNMQFQKVHIPYLTNASYYETEIPLLTRISLHVVLGDYNTN